VNRPAVIALLVLLTIPAAAQDVFVPPVPAGIERDGKVRTPEGPIPFPAEKGKWLRIRSARFDVISNASEGRTRDIVENLETLADALVAANPRFVPPTARATVFVFGSRRESQPYFDLLFGRVNARGYGVYVRHNNGGTMFIDGSRAGHIEQTAMHELVHDLLRRTGVAPPLWLEEGLAEYFGNADIRGGRVTAGRPIRQHMSLMRQKPLIPLADLLATPHESAQGSSSIFYAQSWAAVDWLMALSSTSFFPFLRDVESGTPVAAALQTHYKVSLRDMELAIRRRAGMARLVVLEGGTVEPVPATPLDRATLLYELGAFLTHVAGAETEALRHFREALSVNPNHARALAALGEYERAIAAAPDDPDVHLLYAETLLSTALGDFAGTFTPGEGAPAKFRRARALAERALALGGDEAMARGIAGTSYLVETDFTPGIAQLERAHALAPQRTDVALNLYAMYLRTGAREKADALYASTLANARGKQTLFAARNILLTVETDRANALAKEGKLDEAAAIVRELAAATAEGTGRTDLEQQAAQLASTAAVNREILAYNEAIELTNKGRHAEALTIVDGLVQSATDAQVLKDATELQRELRAELKKRKRR
jgi:tetratricopeptide (TPR) repeat protein